MIRTVFFVLFALGLLELFLLVKTGQWFGAWFPLAAVMLGFVVGGITIRHTGLKSLTELRQASRTGGPGHDAALRGIFGFLAGVLFILPGLLSDALALALLIPWTRRRIEARFSRPRPRTGGVVIDAEAVEIHEDLPPPKTEDEHSPWRRDR